MTIRHKIVALTLTAVLGVALVLGAIAAQLSTRLTDRSVATLEKTLRGNFDRNARLQVEQAVSMLQQLVDRAKKGEMTMDQAKKLGADALRSLRYDKDGYFWADDYAGVNVVLLGRADEGKSRMDKADARGKQFVRDFLSNGRGGGGYTDYYFVRKEGGAQFPKRAYTLAFEPFQWIVGTGNYVDDIDATIESERAATLIEKRRALAATGGTALGLLVLAGLAATLLARSLTRPITTLTEEANRIEAAVSAGKLDTRGDPSRVSEEFRPIVRGTNAVLDAYARPIAVTVEAVSRIAAGDMPPPISESFAGDFERIKQSLNAAVAAVNGLVADTRVLADAAVAGQLATRVDGSRHRGEFRRIVEGVNASLDAVLAPVNEASGVLERLAARDLRARVEGRYQGDHARIQEAVNGTAEALNGALSQVASAVNAVSSASTEIASSSQAVASGASEQASSLEETSSSLESMTSMTRHAADNAQLANSLAGAAKTAAAEGTTAMGEMTTAMERIKASAEGTSQIIKDINEIAFQTNLLALNAAVEAARAGEAGRGFAVVAEEVRSLALRSKEAANKTEALIRESVKEAMGGEVIARAVHAKLSEIGVGAAKSYDVMSEISASAKEQAAGIEQITKAIAQMNQVTQQNAASSEESSSAAAELSGQSAELAALVETFQLDLGVDARASGKPGLAMRLVRPGGLARA